MRSILLACLFTAALLAQAGGSEANLHQGKAHTDRVQEVAFSPDGSLLATTDREGQLRLWEVPTGRLVAEVRTASIATLEFSPDGRTLATGHHDQRTRLWPVPTLRPERVLLPAGPGSANREAIPGGHVAYTSFSPGGRYLVTQGPRLDWQEKGLRLWELPSLKARTDLAGGAWRVGFSGDDRLVAVSQGRDTVRVRDARTGAIVAQVRQEGQQAAPVLSPDGQRLMVRTDRGASLWDTGTGALVAALGPGALGFSPDGRWVASEGSIRDAGTGQEVLRVPTSLQVHFLDGGYVLTYEPEPGKPQGWPHFYMRVFDLESGAATVTLDDRGVPSVAPGGRLLVMQGDLGEALRVWDPLSGSLLGKTEKGSSSLAFSRDGRLLASGREDGTVELWDLEASRTESRLVRVR